MSRSLVVAVFFILLLLALFGWLNVIELRAEEPRRAIVSLEMLLSGNWIVPQINDWTYYNKPPVFNWIMAGFFSLFGSSKEWVVRLPSLLSFIVLAYLHFKISCKYIGREVALLSSIFLLTTADILLYGSVNSGEIDLFYALVVYLQAVVIFKGFHEKKYLKMFLLSYLLVTVGFLTKGLPSLAFQAITLLVTALYHRKFLLLLGWKHLSGIALLFALCGSYLYLYHQHDDAVAFLVRQFKEASQRTGLETSAADTIKQSLTFPLLIAQLLLPWSLLLVFFFRKSFITLIRHNPFITFSALFIISNILLYWFSGDFKPRYYYMFFPFLSTLLAYFYQRSKDDKPLMRKIIFGIFGFVAVVVPAGLIYLFFVPEVTEIPYAALKICLMIILAIAIAILYFRYSYKLLSIALLMVVLRLCLNIFYLPALQKHNEGMYYRDAIAGLLQITADEPVYMFGEPHEFYSDASMGPFTFEEVKLTTAPLIAYQIPYYISSGNGHIVKFVQEMEPGKYHIAPLESLTNKNVEILYKFEDRWKHKIMVLIRP